MPLTFFRSGCQQQTWFAPILFILAVLLFFPALGARDFWAPVEPRYAEIARVMFAEGEWIVPRVNGDLYTDKPILYFWLVLVASNIAGAVNEWTVRLPAALGAVGTVLATYAIGKDFFSPRIGFIAAAVLATSARVIWEGRWAHVDIHTKSMSTCASSGREGGRMSTCSLCVLSHSRCISPRGRSCARAIVAK
jgi:4-amino-4-deoxy-L-arabinose transferase-like glycosyltransferase